MQTNIIMISGGLTRYVPPLYVSINKPPMMSWRSTLNIV